MPISLLYHDVVPAAQAEASGFPGPAARRYKLTPELFRRHLDAVAQVVSRPPAADSIGADDWTLTFDDGGASALDPTAGLLEERGWRGHFFITTDYIGRPGFLMAEQIRALRRRGHVIGSHSCSHPRLSTCPPERIRHEWQASRDALEQVLGEPVTSGAVPGGFYSRAVAQAAAAAGYTVLFNSEPTRRTYDVDGCRIVGRYAIISSTSADEAAALAAGRTLPCLRQAVLWQAKKVAKAVGGGWYLGLTHRLLSVTRSRLR